LADQTVELAAARRLRVDACTGGRPGIGSSQLAQLKSRPNGRFFQRNFLILGALK